MAPNVFTPVYKFHQKHDSVCPLFIGWSATSRAPGKQTHGRHWRLRPEAVEIPHQIVIISRSPWVSQSRAVRRDGPIATNGGTHKLNKNDNIWLHKYVEPERVDVVVCSISILGLDSLNAFARIHPLNSKKCRCAQHSAAITKRLLPVPPFRTQGGGPFKMAEDYMADEDAGCYCHIRSMKPYLHGLFSFPLINTAPMGQDTMAH